jgi:histidine ammonia-lyase
VKSTRRAFAPPICRASEAGVTNSVDLRPGLTPIAGWQAIYRGAPVALDDVARADVEAGRTALAAILSRNGAVTPIEMADGPHVAELVEMRGEPLPVGVLRLLVALKLGSLGQGVSGTRWKVVRALADLLAGDLLPVVAANGSDDHAALAQLYAILTGSGEALRKGKVRPALKALKKAELKPLNLNPRERRALLSGTELSVALALAGLFEAERVLQSAIVAVALSSSLTGSGAALHPRVHRLSRQRGRMEVAAALHELAIGVAHKPSDADAQGDQLPRANISAIGACLDLLRQAGITLERAANGVSEDELVLWQSEEIVEGRADLSSVAVAADQIALALRIIGDMSEARSQSLARHGQAEPEATSAGIEAKASAFAAENRDRSRSTAPDPTGIWRLLPMAGTTALVIAVEFIEAVRIAEAAQSALPPGLEAVRQTVREVAPASEQGVLAATNLASIAVLVGSGALCTAPGAPLPSLVPATPEKRARSR